MLVEGIYDVTGACGCRERGVGVQGRESRSMGHGEVGLPDLLRTLAHGRLTS